MKGMNQYICGFLEAQTAVSRSIDELFGQQFAVSEQNARKIERKVSEKLDMSPKFISVTIEKDGDNPYDQSVSVRFAVGGNVWYVGEKV
jgi:hypothetical protein